MLFLEENPNNQDKRWFAHVMKISILQYAAAVSNIIHELKVARTTLKYSIPSSSASRSRLAFDLLLNAVGTD